MATAFELEGTLKHLFDTQTFASGFSKREFVVEVQDGKFPQMIKFECLKDKTSMLDGLNVGDSLKVAFDIRGSEYKERFYVNLNAWKVAKADGNSGDQAPPADGSSSSFDQSFDNEPDASDDIPF